MEENTDNVELIELKLSEPKNNIKEGCISECKIESNIMYCEILKPNCTLLSNNSVIRIDSIKDPNYEFDHNNYFLSSEINYNINSIEMTCSNFKLSFFLEINELQNKHPYSNMDFEFPIYYRDKKGKAECILPKNGKYIPCVIDATKILFKKDYSIDFDVNNPIKVNEDLNLTLTEIKYKLEGDCGKEIDNSKRLNIQNSSKFIKLILLIYLLF